MTKTGYVSILSNYKRTTFYIGVTSDLERRVAEHREGAIDGFSKRYRLKYLLYYEEVGTINLAITREKQLKNWHREWKIKLIRSMNPTMRDLGTDLLGIADEQEPHESPHACSST